MDLLPVIGWKTTYKNFLCAREVLFREVAMKWWKYESFSFEHKHMILVSLNTVKMEIIWKVQGLVMDEERILR